MNSIEPAGGWKPTAVTTTGDLAVTALKAIDVEHELPPAAIPIEITGDQFQVEAPAGAIEERAKAGGLDAMTLRATRSGLRAIVAVELPEGGPLLRHRLRLPGRGPAWLADGCRKAWCARARGQAGGRS